MSYSCFDQIVGLNSIGMGSGLVLFKVWEHGVMLYFPSRWFSSFFPLGNPLFNKEQIQGDLFLIKIRLLLPYQWPFQEPELEEIGGTYHM